MLKFHLSNDLTAKNLSYGIQSGSTVICTDLKSERVMKKDEEIIVVSERIMERNKEVYKKLAQIDFQCNIAEGCFVDNQIIREYVDDYIEYYPERWRWELKNSPEQNDLYMKTRARRSSRHDYYENNDLLPDFYSIERDAAQFELDHV